MARWAGITPGGNGGRRTAIIPRALLGNIFSTAPIATVPGCSGIAHTGGAHPRNRVFRNGAEAAKYCN